MLKFINSKGFFNTKILEDEGRKLIKKLEVNKDSMYSTFDLFVNGKLRNIEAVANGSALEVLQKNLMDNFLNSIPLPDEVNGFVKGANYRTYLLPHVREKHENRFYLRLDIKDFFGSITPKLVEDSLEEYILVNDKLEKQKILEDIITICFFNNKLPKGAITSPLLSNIIFRRADIRIRKYCRKLNVTYTRYADDMLFSFTKPEKSKKLVGLVNVVLGDFDLFLNYSKIINTKNLISLNGFVVSHGVSISRKKLSKLKKVLFIAETVKTDKGVDILSKLNHVDGSNLRVYFGSVEKLHNYLAGYRSFLLSWMPRDNSKWKTHCHKTIHRIENVLERINA